MRWRRFDAKELLLVLVSAAVLSFSGVASAQIATTDHDLTSTGAGPAEICVYCHTPHTTTANLAAPLWNRNAPAGPFTMYNSTSSPSIDMTVAGSPQGVSLGCLSCHDGATALDSLINPSTVGGVLMTGGAVIGNDLRNDHPISITYNPALDGDGSNFVALNTVQGSSVVRLFGSGNDQVECASCHDPHDNTTAKPFLRVANTGSQICLACHSK